MEMGGLSSAVSPTVTSSPCSVAAEVSCVDVPSVADCTTDAVFSTPLAVSIETMGLQSSIPLLTVCWGIEIVSWITVAVSSNDLLVSSDVVFEVISVEIASVSAVVSPVLPGGFLDNLCCRCHGNQSRFCSTAMKKPPESWWWGSTLMLGTHKRPMLRGANTYISSNFTIKSQEHISVELESMFDSILTFPSKRRSGTLSYVSCHREHASGNVMYSITKKKSLHMWEWNCERKESNTQWICTTMQRGNSKQGDCVHSNIEVVVARKGGNMGKVLTSRTQTKIKANSWAWMVGTIMCHTNLMRLDLVCHKLCMHLVCHNHSSIDHRFYLFPTKPSV